MGVKSSWYPFPSLIFSNCIWPSCVNFGYPEWPVAGCSVLGSAQCSQPPPFVPAALTSCCFHGMPPSSVSKKQLFPHSVPVPWAISQTSRRTPPQCPSPKLKSTGSFRAEVTDTGAVPGLFLSSEQTQQWQEVLPCQEISWAADGLTTPWVLPAHSGRDQQ